MENLRKRGKVKLLMLKIKRWVSKPTFLSQKIFSRNVRAVLEMKTVLTLDEAIYIGFSI